MRDTVVWRAFASPSGGWDGTAYGLLLICIVAFCFWVTGLRRKNNSTQRSGDEA